MCWKSLEKELRPLAEKAAAIQELNKKLDTLGVTPTCLSLIKISVYPEFNEVVLKRERDGEYFSIMANEIDELIEQLAKAKQEMGDSMEKKSLKERVEELLKEVARLSGIITCISREVESYFGKWLVDYIKSNYSITLTSVKKERERIMKKDDALLKMAKKNAKEKIKKTKRETIQRLLRN